MAYIHENGQLINRRSLIACCASGLLLPKALRAGQPPYVPPATYAWLPIGFRTRGIPGTGTVFDTTNSFVLDQQAFQAPSWATVEQVKIVYAQFDKTSNGEVDRAVTASVKTAVYTTTESFTVPSGSAASGASSLALVQTGASQVTVGSQISGTGIPSAAYITSVSSSYTAGTGVQGAVTITFAVAGAPAVTSAAVPANSIMTIARKIRPVLYGGSTTGVLTPSHRFLISDPVPVTLAPGAFFRVRTDAQMSSTGFLTQAFQTNGVLNGDASQRSTTDIGLVLGPNLPTATDTNFWGPVGILALLPTPQKVVLGVGDSITFGVGDFIFDSGGRSGYFAKSLANTIPWFSTSRASNVASYNVNGFEGDLAAAQMCGATDVVLALCRNDISAGYTAAQVKATLAVMQAAFLAMGLRVWAFTVLPTTTSTDSWVTTANQTVQSSVIETQRQAYNSDIRVNWKSYGYQGLIDLAAIVEDPANPGKWNVTGGAWTPDGVHPSTIAVTAAVAAGICTPSRFVLGV